MKSNTIKNFAPRALLLIAWLLFPQSAQCFYNPSTGRWLSRDPKEEKGGPNLLAFVNNAPIGNIDPLGLTTGQMELKCCKDTLFPSCEIVCAMAVEAAIKGSLFVAGGAVICYNSVKCACLLPFPAIGYKPGECKEIDDVIKEHETGHLPNTVCNKCGLYDAPPAPGLDEEDEECQKRTKTVEQLKALNGKLNAKCAAVAEAIITGLGEWVSQHCDNGHKKHSK